MSPLSVAGTESRLLAAEGGKRKGLEGAKLCMQTSGGPWGTNARASYRPPPYTPGSPKGTNSGLVCSHKRGLSFQPNSSPRLPKPLPPLSLLLSCLILTLLRPLLLLFLPAISHTLLIVCVQHTVHSPFVFVFV